MPRKKKTNGDQPIGIGVTTKQMKRKKPIGSTYLLDIEPITENQKRVFDSYAEDKHLVAYGTAGTGKTFISLYNALADILDETTPYEKIYLVRSLVSTREIGFLPGDHEDKADIYQIPYKNMVKYMFQMPSDADFEMLYVTHHSNLVYSFLTYLSILQLHQHLALLTDQNNLSTNQDYLYTTDPTL